MSTEIKQVSEAVTRNSILPSALHSRARLQPETEPTQITVNLDIQMPLYHRENKPNLKQTRKEMRMENAAVESVLCLWKHRDEIQGGTAEMSHTQWQQQNTKSGTTLYPGTDSKTEKLAWSAEKKLKSTLPLKNHI